MQTQLRQILLQIVLYDYFPQQPSFPSRGRHTFRRRSYPRTIGTLRASCVGRDT